MPGESRQRDCKSSYNPHDARARLELVKILVAMANSGGGEVCYGLTETDKLGLDVAVASKLDSASVANQVERYITPAVVVLSHDFEELSSGRLIVTLRVEPAKYPIVMSRPGNFEYAPGKQDSAFHLGDVWTRHSTKTERITFEDLRDWIDRAKEEERDRILQRITTLVKLPDNAEIHVVSKSDEPIDTPQKLLESAVNRRRRDPNHLLTGKELLHLFCNRQLFDVTCDGLSLVIASGLRRNGTLYWWLAGADDSEELIVSELRSCLSSSDRDRSDAGRGIAELAAVYADDGQLADILDKLRTSGYKHFREVTDAWVGREEQRQQLKTRIERARDDSRRLGEYEVDELERHATSVAIQLSEKSSAALSRRLGDITRVIWSKKSRFAARIWGE